MPTSAWHEGHQMAGYLNTACSECERERKREYRLRLTVRVVSRMETTDE